MTSLQSSLVAQFRQPHGALGRLAGWIMTRRGSNRRRNAWTVSLLDVQPDDRVLEVGFGPGLAVEQASQRAVRGKVVGVDHSDVMWRVATRRNRRAIVRGAVELHHAAVSALPNLGGGFDKVLTVNCLMFWPEPVATLRALRAEMKPGATLAITHQPRKPGATLADVEEAERAIAAQCVQAGFELLRSERLPLEPVPASCVLVQRPA